MAETLHLAVIVINQVGADTSKNSDDTVLQDRVAVRAALGTSWHHCVSTRLFLEHTIQHQDFDVEYGNQHEGHRIEMVSNQYSNHKIHSRCVSVVKSNLAPASSTNFEINFMGIVEA